VRNGGFAKALLVVSAVRYAGRIEAAIARRESRMALY
jgi:hypothetical protein